MSPGAHQLRSGEAQRVGPALLDGTFGFAIHAAPGQVRLMAHLGDRQKKDKSRARFKYHKETHGIAKRKASRNGGAKSKKRGGRKKSTKNGQPKR